MTSYKQEELEIYCVIKEKMEYIYNLEVFMELKWTVIVLKKKRWWNIDPRKVFINKLFNKLKSLV